MALPSRSKGRVSPSCPVLLHHPLVCLIPGRCTLTPKAARYPRLQRGKILRAAGGSQSVFHRSPLLQLRAGAAGHMAGNIHSHRQTRHMVGICSMARLRQVVLPPKPRHRCPVHLLAVSSPLPAGRSRGRGWGHPAAQQRLFGKIRHLSPPPTPIPARWAGRGWSPPALRYPPRTF